MGRKRLAQYIGDPWPGPYSAQSMSWLYKNSHFVHQVESVVHSKKSTASAKPVTPVGMSLFEVAEYVAGRLVQTPPVGTFGFLAHELWADRLPRVSWWRRRHGAILSSGASVSFRPGVRAWRPQTCGICSSPEAVTISTLDAMYRQCEEIDAASADITLYGGDEELPCLHLQVGHLQLRVPGTLTGREPWRIAVPLRDFAHKVEYAHAHLVGPDAGASNQLVIQTKSTKRLNLILAHLGNPQDLDLCTQLWKRCLAGSLNRSRM